MKNAFYPAHRMCIFHSSFFISAKPSFYSPLPSERGRGWGQKRVHYRNPIMHPKKSLSSKKVPRTKIRNTIARRWPDGQKLVRRFFRFFFLLRLPKFFWINTILHQLSDALNSCFTVCCVSHAKPLTCGVEHLHCCSAVVDEFVHHERNEELSL